MQKITFHTFNMGDVEDPELYAAQPLYEWQNTVQGQWVMAHCNNPKYIIQGDAHSWGNKVVIYGDVEDQLATEFLLRWSK
jgi:hypothetical protein